MCTEKNLVWDNMELPLNDNHLCMDCSPSECPTMKQMESAMESVGIDVLDDCFTRTGVGLGC